MATPAPLRSRRPLGGQAPALAPRPGADPQRDDRKAGNPAAEPGLGRDRASISPLRLRHLVPVRPQPPLGHAEGPGAALARSFRPLAPGIRYGCIVFNGQRLHALLLDRGAKLDAWVGGRSAQGGHRTETVVEMGQGAVAATNGSFSSPADAAASEPLGPAIAEGAVASDAATTKAGWGPVPRSFLGQDQDGFFIGETRPGETGTGLLARLQRQGRKPRTVLGGLGSLIQAGQPADQHARAVQGLTDGQASDAPNARTVAGLTRDGRLLLLSEAGDEAAGKGAGVHQLAELLLSLRTADPTLDVTDGVILDGGGTAEMVVPGLAVDSRAGEHHRTIPTGLRVLPATTRPAAR